MRKKAYGATRVNHVDVAPLLDGRDGHAVTVGIDVGKYDLLAVARWADGRFARPWRARNPGERGPLVAPLQRLGTGRQLVVAPEPSGTYGDALRQALADGGIEVRRVGAQAAHDSAAVFDGVPSQHDGTGAAVGAELAAPGKGRPWAYEPAAAGQQELAYRKALGLNLVARSSGTCRGPLHLSQRGSAPARPWRYFAALRLVRRAGARGWYAAPKARPPAAQRVPVARMRKPAPAPYHLGVTGPEFDPRRRFAGAGRAAPAAGAGGAARPLGPTPAAEPAGAVAAGRGQRSARPPRAARPWRPWGAPTEVSGGPGSAARGALRYGQSGGRGRAARPR